MTNRFEVPEEAVEAAAMAEWVQYGSQNPFATWETEDPEYKEYLRTSVRSVLAAAAPFMSKVVTSDAGLLPGTVIQDQTGDVLKMMKTGDWRGTYIEGGSDVEYPATVLVYGDGSA